MDKKNKHLGNKSQPSAVKCNNTSVEVFPLSSKQTNNRKFYFLVIRVPLSKFKNMKTLIVFFASCVFSIVTFAQNADSANFYYNKGLKAKLTGLFAIAAKDFEKAVDFNPEFTEAYIANGETNLSMRAISKAQENFNKAYRVEPEKYRSYSPSYHFIF